MMETRLQTLPACISFQKLGEKDFFSISIRVYHMVV